MSQSPAERILIVEPDDDLATLFVQYFTEHGPFNCQRVGLGGEAVRSALAQPPHVILIETQLPDKPGLHVLHELLASPRTAQIPIFFLAGGTETILRNQILAAGAHDFITKPVDVAELNLRLRNTLKRIQRDIALHPKTGLPIGSAVQNALERCREQDTFYIIRLQIRGFEAFQEIHGFITAGEVIVFAGAALTELTKAQGTPTDFVGHLSETEFVIGTTPEKGPAMLQALQTRLGDRLPQFHSYIERDQGYMAPPEEAPTSPQYPLMQLKCWIEYTT
ncbi:MAG: response regulator [Anaerolineales bacterium]